MVETRVVARPSRSRFSSACWRMRVRSAPRIVFRAEARSESNCRYTRSEEHTSELQSLMRISYAVFCLKKKNNTHEPPQIYIICTKNKRETTKNHQTVKQ